MTVNRFLMAVAMVIATWQPTAAQPIEAPRLEQHAGKWQLMVDGQPFLMLAGELHNSSTGSVHHMQDIWPRMAAKQLNTVLAAVSWELLEPEEGHFDFSIVDAMLSGARQARLRLVLLWFGAWKNGASTYVPGWVKRSPERFPLACLKGGEVMNTLSALGSATREADCRALTALMQHLHKVDKQYTVVAIQLENEVGTLDAASAWGGGENRAMRDYSSMADSAFEGDVPEALITYIKRHRENLQPAIRKAWEAQGQRTKGNWEQVFGHSDREHPFEVDDVTHHDDERWKVQYPYLAEELFNAWNYAAYIGQLADVVKRVHPMPVIVNAWLKGDTHEPGRYPSGGPQFHLIDIYRAAARQVDLLAPDIYATHLFDWIVGGYDQPDNPVLIPETHPNSDAAARAFYAFGRYNVVGYSPFGIDGAGIINGADPEDHSFDRAYTMLRHLTPYIIKHRIGGLTGGVLLDGERQEDRTEMGEYVIAVRRFTTEGAEHLVGVAGEEVKVSANNVAGLCIVQEAPDQFLVAGGIGSMIISIYPRMSSRRAAIERVDEVTFLPDGQEQLHRLNGDETTLGDPVIRSGEVKAFRIKMYQY